MANTYSKQVQTLLGDTKVGLDNAQTNEIIKPRIANRGYDDTAIAWANTKRTDLANKYREYQRKSADQIDATEKLRAEMEKQKSFFMDCRILAKRVLRSASYKGYREKLGLEDKIQKSYKGFLDQSGKFFEHAMQTEEIKLLLAKVGITETLLQQGLDGLVLLEQLNDDQEAKKGAVQVARKERDDIYVELKNWWIDFKVVCRIEFKDNPQYLEILGILAPSEGYKRKKKTPKTPKTPETPETPETPGGVEG
ncbi:MAG: hypothetical protein GY950_18465 [bacterium]|nr:hypothetical protein [bacterium]